MQYNVNNALGFKKPRVNNDLFYTKSIYGIVCITTLPEVQLALDHFLNLFFFADLLAFTALLLLGFGSLVDLPVLAHYQVVFLRVELAKLLETRVKRVTRDWPVEGFAAKLLDLKDEALHGL